MIAISLKRLLQREWESQDMLAGFIFPIPFIRAGNFCMENINGILHFNFECDTIRTTVKEKVYYIGGIQ